MSNDPRFTDKTENPAGLHRRYFVQKADGSPVSPEAEYFVLRLDSNGSDPAHIAACRKAVMTYADEIEPHLPRLAEDLRERYAPDVAGLEDEANARATEAERVAAAYCGDGQRFYHAVTGEPLDDYCEAAGGFFEHTEGLERYEFADGSAIVIDDGGWDIEGHEPFTRRG